MNPKRTLQYTVIFLLVACLIFAVYPSTKRSFNEYQAYISPYYQAQAEKRAEARRDVADKKAIEGVTQETPLQDLGVSDKSANIVRQDVLAMAVKVCGYKAEDLNDQINVLPTQWNRWVGEVTVNYRIFTKSGGSVLVHAWTKFDATQAMTDAKVWCE